MESTPGVGSCWNVHHGLACGEGAVVVPKDHFVLASLVRFQSWCPLRRSRSYWIGDSAMEAAMLFEEEDREGALSGNEALVYL